ncbi:MAG TPA: LytR C-terminal domain-containing protein [Treponemataceae bacterium]|nr:LytR C-terminal domain-containing protein [Treponemataceae bacterium]
MFSANIDKKALQKLLLQISLIDAERLVPQTVTGSLRSVDGKSLLFPYYDGQLIKDVCKQTMSALVSSAEGAQNRIYVLEIQNGTTIQGLAKNTAALLQSVGYDVLSMVNAPSNDVEKTYIMDHIGNNDAAKGIGSFIRCESIVTDEIDLDETNLEAASLVDFTIVLGSDFDGRYVR